MGLLVEGRWQDRWYDTGSTGGRFVRKESQFRNWITADGSAGPTGEGGFTAEPGRYHLYVSLACPWAHRTLIFRKLKGLEPMIDVSVVHWHMGEQGWTFETAPGATGDACTAPASSTRSTARPARLHGPRHRAGALGQEAETIVNNESSEIIRMLNSAFDGIGARPGDYYPEALRAEIDAVNARVYDTVNNGVYKAGFATTQEAYEEAVIALFDSLDWLEDRLSRQRYLVGERITEADWRLFTTLVRFDPVYLGHFKCNLRRIADYPNLSGYLRELYQWPGVAETVDLDHIKHHYYGSHTTINPTGIVPKGPILDLDTPHGRDRLRAA